MPSYLFPSREITRGTWPPQAGVSLFSGNILMSGFVTWALAQNRETCQASDKGPLVPELALLASGWLSGVMRHLYLDKSSR